MTRMQADFTVIRRGRAPLLALVATLGYSRASFVRFTAGKDATTLCEWTSVSPAEFDYDETRCMQGKFGVLL